MGCHPFWGRKLGFTGTTLPPAAVFFVGFGFFSPWAVEVTAATAVPVCVYPEPTCGKITNRTQGNREAEQQKPRLQ